MDSNCSYEIVLGISLFLFLVICIIICIDLSFDGIRNIKFLPTKSVSALFFLGIVAYYGTDTTAPIVINKIIKK